MEVVLLHNHDGDLEQNAVSVWERFISRSNTLAFSMYS
jgi:hypothetical protein